MGSENLAFLDRYALKDDTGTPIESTPEEMWERVSWAIAQVEKENVTYWHTEFFNLLEDFKFVPGGRILHGAGNAAKVSFYNCFTIPSPHDSRDGIWDSLKLWSEIMARGGGVGVNLSSLRPNGSYIKSVNGFSSGPMAWAELYSVATGRVISQGGTRRGAAMIMLWDWHPDIEEFITRKSEMITEEGSNGRKPKFLEFANVSVAVSDGFMRAVKADDNWELKFPDLTDPHYDKEWDGDLHGWIQKGYRVKVYKTVKARDLWKLICKAAWESAEPGVVFLERCNKEHPGNYFEKVICVNPCVTGDTLVYTENQGLVPIRELVEYNSVSIVSPDESTSTYGPFNLARRVFSSGVKPVFKLLTKEGHTLRLTENHKVMTTIGWKEAKDLKKGDKLNLFGGTGGFGDKGSNELGKVLGWLIGDGYLNHKDKKVVLDFYREKRELTNEFINSIKFLVEGMQVNSRSYGISATYIESQDKDTISSTRLYRLLDPELLIDKLQVPTSVFQGTRATQESFLCALFTADGSIQGTKNKGFSIRLSSNSVPLLQGTQRLLLNFGINSKIYENRRLAGVRMLPNSERLLAPYKCQANHELVISKVNVIRYANTIGFELKSKSDKLNQAMQGRNRGFYKDDFCATFDSLEFDGEEEVFDLTEPINHRFVANGFIVHNCGEQPLPAYGVCNLGSMNLNAFVGANGLFDYEGFSYYVKVAVRFLDNAIDLTPHFLGENEEIQRKSRRIGLGTMGLADALISMGYRYGSDRSLKEIEKIYQCLRDSAYQASMELAKEKGAFPAFNKSIHTDGKFFRGWDNEDILDAIDIYGLRNSVLLTQAPTGTTSLLAGVSSGIEPIFSPITRRTDRLGTRIITHPAWEEFAGKDLPVGYTHLVTAMDLTPEDHIRVQATVQKYIDTSISKTANVPNSYTSEDIEKLYMLAYDSRCKGVTCYRTGSRDAVLEEVITPTVKLPTSIEESYKYLSELSNEIARKVLGTDAVLEEEPTINNNNAIKFPILRNEDGWPGRTYKIKTPLEDGNTVNLYITVNGLQGTPLEIFINGPAANKTDHDFIARSVSQSLRYGLPVDDVIENGWKIRGMHFISIDKKNITCTANAISYALERWLGDENPPKIKSPESPELYGKSPSDYDDKKFERINVRSPNCPVCFNPLIRHDGCWSCSSCAYSKCE